MRQSRSDNLVALTIGARVRARRIENNLSEQAVARAIDKSIAHLQAAEEGQCNFDAEDIVALCPVLRVMPSWFFEGLSVSGAAATS